MPHHNALIKSIVQTIPIFFIGYEFVANIFFFSCFFFLPPFLFPLIFPFSAGNAAVDTVNTAVPEVIKVPSQFLDSSSESSSSDEEDIIEDWTTTVDEFDVVADSDDASTEQKVASAPAGNFIPETEHYKFFHQFTLDQQRTLLAIMETHTYEDNKMIVKQGEDGDSFYLIKEGEAVVLKTNSDGVEKELTHLYRGQSFGEIALIYGGKRGADVKSVGRCVCLSLSKSVFEQQHEVRMFLVSSKVPMLSGLAPEDRLNIVSKLQPRAFASGDFVIKEGDRVVDDAFYMITEGQAAVVEINQENGEERILTRLFEGHCFGEMALVSDKTRSASIVAKTALKCMCLTKQDFQGSLAGGALKAIIEKQSKERTEIRLKRKQSGTCLMTKGRKKMLRQQSLVDQELHFQTVTTLVKKGSHKKGDLFINQYRVDKKLGMGSYSTVYLGYDTTRDDTKVAIKVMDKHSLGKKSPGQKTSALDDVMHEIKAQKQLKHRGIVQLIECINDPHHKDMYLIQECVEGGEILVNEPLVPERARKYFCDLLRGVEYMHSKHVIHRDIKPENILLTKDDRTKIADFGTAAIVSNGGGLSVPKGTPAFMAPELLSYDTVKYSGRPCDIWSLGATLYMLVVGAPPWMANTEMELAYKVQYNEVVFPEACALGANKLNPHLMHLIKRMLDKDASKRPLLGEVMTHEWVTAEGSEPLPPLFNYGQPKSTTTTRVTSLTDEIVVEGDEESSGDDAAVDEIGDMLSLNLGDEEIGSYSDSDSDGSSDESVTDGFDGPSSPKIRPAPGGSGGSRDSGNGGEESKNDPLDLLPLSSDVVFPRSCYVGDPSLRADEVAGMACGCFENIGTRSNMEDKPVALMHLPTKTDHAVLSLFGTYDGHGGDGTSKRLQKELHLLLSEEEDLLGDVEAAVRRAWHRMDWRLLTSSARTLQEKRSAPIKSLMRTARKVPNQDNHLSGATAATVVFVRRADGSKQDGSKQDGSKQELVVCWAGDSRVVLSSGGGVAVDLSEDHKASRPDEKKRIQAAGGSVGPKGRIGRDLAVSRAFGDIMHKGAMNGDEFLELITKTTEENAALLQEGPLIATPDIVRRSVHEDDEFVIIATDGIWDVLTSQEAVLYVRRYLATKEGDVDGAAKGLVRKALVSGTVDNVSAVVVVLNQRKNGGEEKSDSGTLPAAPQTPAVGLAPPITSK